MLIDQHIQAPDAVYGGLLRSAGGHDVGAGGARAAHRRAGGPGVRAAAAGSGAIGWSTNIRSSRRRDDSPDAIREFTQRCTDVLEMYVRRHPELWLWMHRRWRDSAVADAGDPGMFPPAARDDARDEARDDA